MFRLCDDCYLQAYCAKKVAVHMDANTVRNADVRLRLQNYLVGLRMPFRQIEDFIVEGLRDFEGLYVDEAGKWVPTPAIGCLLTPASEFWFRDQMEGGIWIDAAQVPALRREAIGRWRLVGTIMGIKETVWPRCC
jgi:hypothetical protein